MKKLLGGGVVSVENIFLIVDNESNLPVFIGALYNPVV